MTMGLDWSTHEIHCWPPLNDQIIGIPASDSPLAFITFANGMGTQFIAVIPDARRR